jgi:hypothetical protein
MNLEVEFRRILDQHKNKTLNERRIERIVKETLRVFGIVKPKRTSSGKTCIVAAADPESGETVIKKVKPQPYGAPPAARKDIFIGGPPPRNKSEK